MKRSGTFAPGRWLIYLLPASVFVVMLRLTWFRWGDFIIDTFRDQWVFLKLSQGAVLYRDVLYFYGFLPPYIIAFLNAFFGVHIKWTVYAGIAVSVATLVALYRVSRYFFDRYISALILVQVICVCFFSSWGIFNFILPYSVASTFFTCFLFFALFFFLGFVRKGRRVKLVPWAFFTCLAMLSRPDYGLMSWGVFFLVGLMRAKRSGGWKDMFGLALPPACAAFLFAVFFSYAGGAGSFLKIVGGYSVFACSKSQFSYALTGFDNIPGNLLLVFGVFVVFAGSLMLFRVISPRISKMSEHQGMTSGVYFAYAFSAAVGLFCGSWFGNVLGIAQYSMLPLLLVAVIVSAGYGNTKEDGRAQALMTLCVALLSLVLIGRILLKVHPQGYGFFLLIPSMVSMYVFTFRMVPGAVRGFDPLSARAAYIYRIFAACFLMMSMTFFLRGNIMYYRDRNVGIDLGGKGELFFSPTERTYVFILLAEYLGKVMGPSDTLVVFPEGVALNYLLGKDNPLWMETYVPDCVNIMGQEALAAAIKDKRVDYAVVFERDTTEYGYPVFGVDYAPDIKNLLKEDYHLDKVVDEIPFTGWGYGAIVLKRNDRDK
ncbi:MAG: hypothetical protein PHH49_02130 [Candidatus Omnitrophica bacterium]|nr:hypothetical protein [Candidatus Omnitrophota bacterium]MDD5487744.1 hypothetical protein [Candidatus Omnitrophota bacterium]